MRGSMRCICRRRWMRSRVGGRRRRTVSNSQGNRPQYWPHEPSLDTLALAEWLAELRAAGDAPQLSALIAALPDAAGDLANATMLDALVAEAEADDPQAGEPPVERASEGVMSPVLLPG